MDWKCAAELDFKLAPVGKLISRDGKTVQVILSVAEREPARAEVAPSQTNNKTNMTIVDNIFFIFLTLPLWHR